MATIEHKIKLDHQYNIKAKLPRKLKKDIIKVSGREAYKEMIAKMDQYYSFFGYHKFNIRKVK